MKRVYMLAGVLLVVVLGATGIAALLLAASASPDLTAAGPTASPAANVAGASSAAGVSSSVRTLYAHGDRLRPLVEETGGGQTLNIYGPGGQIIAQVARDGSGGQEARYLLADHLGSTRPALDAHGNPVARFEYGPYGETTASGTADVGVRYRYTGHAYDEEQRVYETPARGYDPTTGRFLSVDPQRQDASPYVYAGNNPVLYKDRTGKGRTGTVVTPKVFKLAKKWANETSTYESNSKVLHEINDPRVKAWFLEYEKLAKTAPTVFHDFVDKLIHAQGVEKGDMVALREAFSELEGAVPKLPWVDAQRRVKVMSNIKRYHRGVGRDKAGEAHRTSVIWREFDGEKEAYYKSERVLDSLLATPESERPDPDAPKGYGNCSLIASCVAGQIARTDPEVNVELIRSGPDIDHVFALVGRDPRTDVSKPMTWNESALIVDGWNGLVTEARQYYAQGLDPRFYNKMSSPELYYTFE